ncbi:hypothetical protein LPW11_02850 [Geomonas sp. RF6]|uniref:hypothetical protein n=1 Tax=Geomonas sp. RF6 TaxID=2897342 RepID=UPI001E34C6E3|nr:hypothetical protein [Geomonas sp. RF6]UFS71138.1 hypothetical protein LPW11_02850 [Geomonas sp. RF6]
MPPVDGADSRRPPAIQLAALLFLLFLLFPRTSQSAPPPPLPASDDSEIILTVDLDGEPLADGLLALERGGRVYLPLCPLAEALSLAIRCTGTRAYGFIIEESRPIVIDLEEGYLVSVRSVYALGDAAFAASGEVMAESGALSRWLPVDLVVEKESSALHVHPRETLPMQGFKKRGQGGQVRPPAPAKAQYQEVTAQRGAVSLPTVDLTSQLQLLGEGGRSEGVARNALQMAGDLFYLSGVAHVAFENDSAQRLDVTLSKRRDHPFLIGPLPVTTFAIGALQPPTVDGIGGSTTTMYGMAFSNRPLSGSSHFLSHDIDGYLPEGWDAELLHNGVPVGYQPPSADGMYHFRNLRIHYGVNDFKVILHGPFGETRLSEQTFVTDSTTPKGNFLYTLSTAWQTGLTDREPGTGDESNVTFTSDFGITDGVTGSALLVRRTDSHDNEEEYLGLGARSALGYTLLSLEVLQRISGAEDRGQLFTVKSSGRYLGDLSVESSVRLFHDFSSPQFEKDPDPLLAQGLLRGSTSLDVWDGVRCPLSVQLNLEERRSGRTNFGSAWRVSGGWNGWNAALEGAVAYLQREVNAGGMLQISTLVQGVSVRGQVGFTIAPTVSPSVINLSADRDLGDGVLLNSAFSHDTLGGVSALRVGLSKKLGLLGYSISATGDSNGAYGFNVAVSTSLAPDRVNSQVVVASEPLSSYGMIAATAWLRGVPGSPGKPLPQVGFLVNGGRPVTVTGSAGVPVIAYLQPDIPVDITVDLSTLEDPFMVALEDGCHITPRAGSLAACRFTIVTGGEIDGMVLIKLPSGEVPLKGVRVELLREGTAGTELAASTLTEESGYYLFKTVRPGRYRVAIPEEEGARLKAVAGPPLTVTMPEGGDQVTGNDFLLNPRLSGS